MTKSTTFWYFKDGETTVVTTGADTMGDSDFVIIDNTQEARDKFSGDWLRDSFELSLADIQALQSGKLLAHFNGEWVTFVELKTPSAMEGLAKDER